MSIQAYKIAALFRKDLKDTLKNGNWMLLCILPVLMTVLFRYLFSGEEYLPPQFLLSIGLLMNLSLLPLSTTSMMIAEEKEKYTLRTLMLSNVSAAEFLLSKALVIYLLMQCANSVIYVLSGPESMSFPYFLLITTLTSIPMIFFGALVGVIAKNQMRTGTIASPLALLFMLPAMLAQVDEGMAAFARFTPTHAMMQLISGVSEGFWFSVGVLVAWMILSALAFGLVYRRKRLD